MSGSRLLILGLVLSVAHCLEMADSSDEGSERRLTGVLGEDVYLSCRYDGDMPISSAVWKRQRNSHFKTKRLAGFKDGRAFSHDADFSLPDSPSNLTVKMKVSSMEAEGEYTCVFVSDEEEFTGKVFLQVLVRPDTHIWVNEEVVNGTRYQSAVCSADNGKPLPKITWLIDGNPPQNDFFSEERSEATHPNGTTTISSALRFPTHLQDEDSLTCEVTHPALPRPELATVRVDTYAAPNLTVTADLVREEKGEYWVVSCVASGGRPETDISLVTTPGDPPQREDGADAQTRLYRLPADVYEGRNVTCAFDHPKFAQTQLRATQLPSFYLSGVQLRARRGNTSSDTQDVESLELEEGQSNVTIALEVFGNVPRYAVFCKTDDEHLPPGVAVVGNVLRVLGPVRLLHAGLYECKASYRRHSSAVQFNIRVKPQVVHPVPPMIKVDLWNGPADRVVECSAADGVPAANMSWLLPEGVSVVPRFNSTRHNGRHSVTGVLLLPPCSPQELTVHCMINHPAFETPERRSVTLPLCAPPNITITSSTEWRDGAEYTEVECRVDSAPPAASIAWRVGDSDIGPPERVDRPLVVQADGSVTVLSTVRFLSSRHSGHNLSCVVEHQSLEVCERRNIYIPVPEAPVLRAFLIGPPDSPLWRAVCSCRGGGVAADLTWILPDNSTGPTSWRSEREGRETELTYQFPLASHEGRSLTCLVKYQHGTTERRTIHIPRYYISSVRVLNHTIRLKSRNGGDQGILRLTLQENLHNQSIFLHVVGNVPTYNLTCQRSDGSLLQMVGVALVFPSALSLQDGGLIACQASFHHHQASLRIQLEVFSLQSHSWILIAACVSSASAIALFLTIILWVFCEITHGAHSKKPESLASLTSLHDPCSPERKKPRVPGEDTEYAQLVGYSIVIDVKSTV